MVNLKLSMLDEGWSDESHKTLKVPARGGQATKK